MAKRGLLLLGLAGVGALVYIIARRSSGITFSVRISNPPAGAIGWGLAWGAYDQFNDPYFASAGLRDLAYPITVPNVPPSAFLRIYISMPTGYQQELWPYGSDHITPTPNQTLQVDLTGIPPRA